MILESSPTFPCRYRRNALTTIKVNTTAQDLIRSETWRNKGFSLASMTANMMKLIYITSLNSKTKHPLNPSYGRDPTVDSSKRENWRFNVRIPLIEFRNRPTKILSKMMLATCKATSRTPTFTLQLQTAQVRTQSTTSGTQIQVLWRESGTHFLRKLSQGWRALITDSEWAISITTSTRTTGHTERYFTSTWIHVQK